MAEHTPRAPDRDALIAAVPPAVLGICQRLAEQGQRGWVVGGCVRDLLLQRPVGDWDVATDARPEQVIELFRRVIPTGLQHGTVTVLVGGTPYEVTTLRGEGAYGDGRHPDQITFLDDITQDLARRDFTINAIALDPLARTLTDPFDGQADLHRRLLRAVGRPLDRFTEDGLRILRAARFAATLECAIEPATLEAMTDPRSLATFRRVSAERVREEWLKAMRAPAPSVAFELMRQTAMLAVHAAELGAMVGCQQNRWHAYDVWEHTMHCVDACPPDPVLRIAALLHDLGKPATRTVSDKTQDYAFHHHEVAGAQQADALLRRLRFSNEQRARVVHLVRHHLVVYADEWSDGAVRRWLRRVGPERVDDVLALALADAHAKGRDASDTIRAIERLRERVAALQEAGAALSRRDLALDGKALMRELDLAPSKLVGDVLTALLELVTDDPSANEPERLLAEARAYLAARGRD